jgi:hypothetical protein
VSWGWAARVIRQHKRERHRSEIRMFKVAENMNMDKGIQVRYDSSPL